MIGTFARLATSAQDVSMLRHLAGPVMSCHLQNTPTILFRDSAFAPTRLSKRSAAVINPNDLSGLSN